MNTIISFSKQRKLDLYRLDTFDGWNDIWVAVSLELPALMRKAPEDVPCSYAKIPFNGRDCHVFYNNFIISGEQKESWSPTSGALYLGRSANKLDGLLLQYMPPHSKTSKHYHTYKREIFHNLLGGCSLELEGSSILLEKNSRAAEPGQIHQVKTFGCAALNLLEIIGDPKGITLDDHTYVEE